MRRLGWGLFTLSTLTIAGCGAGAGSGSTLAPAPAPETAMGADEFEALFQARADSARMSFTAADVDFLRMMIPHHTQALEMSAFASTRTTTPAILTLAARITAGQSEEIARMRHWMRDRGIPEVDTGEQPSEHMEHMHEMPDAMAEAHSMPGLLTSAQMEELAEARGLDFDRHYLEFMIYHHLGAIEMVNELFATDGAGKEGEIFLLAAEIRVDQATEVARMERMLSSLQGEPDTP